MFQLIKLQLDESINSHMIPLERERIADSCGKFINLILLELSGKEQNAKLRQLKVILNFAVSTTIVKMNLITNLQRRQPVWNFVRAPCRVCYLWRPMLKRLLR